MDEGFVRRTYRTTAWVLALVVLYVMGLGGIQVAWSIAAGTALGLLVLRAFEWLVQSVLVPGRQPPNWLVVKVTVLKLPVLGLLLYWVVSSGWFHLAGFAGGVTLVQAVIFLKALGIFLMQREADRQRGLQ